MTHLSLFVKGDVLMVCCGTILVTDSILFVLAGILHFLLTSIFDFVLCYVKLLSVSS